MYCGERILYESTGMGTWEKALTKEKLPKHLQEQLNPENLSVVISKVKKNEAFYMPDSITSLRDCHYSGAEPTFNPHQSSYSYSYFSGVLCCIAPEPIYVFWYHGQ